MLGIDPNQIEQLLEGEEGYIPPHLLRLKKNTAVIPEEKMGSIVAGKESEYLFAQLKPFLENIKKSKIEDMKQAYRDGIKDEVSLKVAVGLLCAVDDLESSILSFAKKGQEIERKMKENGTN